MLERMREVGEEIRVNDETLARMQSEHEEFLLLYLIFRQMMCPPEAKRIMRL